MLRPGGVLVRTACSLISSGTERQKVNLAQQSLLGKARERPDQVMKVLSSFKQEGFLNTLNPISISVSLHEVPRYLKTPLRHAMSHSCHDLHRGVPGSSGGSSGSGAYAPSSVSPS